MKKMGLFAVGVVIVGAIVFLGCDLLNSSNDSPDLKMLKVEYLKTGDQITGVRVVIGNEGKGDAKRVGYVVILSTDENLSVATDYTLYRSEISSLAAGASVQVDLDLQKSINPYLEGAKSTPPSAGLYTLGAMVNPDTMENTTPGTCSAFCLASMWWIDGQPYSYAVKLTVGLPANLTYWVKSDYPGFTTAHPVESGAHKLIVCLQPASYSPPALSPDANGFVEMPMDSSSVTAPATYRELSVNYDKSAGATTAQFALGAHAKDYYRMYLLLDGYDSNTILMQFKLPMGTSGPVYLNPWQTHPADALTGGSFSVTGDMTIPGTIQMQAGTHQ